MPLDGAAVTKPDILIETNQADTGSNALSLKMKVLFA
jgi:hypothetical protein